MRISTLLSLACATLIGAGALTACGDDDDNGPVTPAATPSKLGESCARTADCEAGLSCISNICVDGDGAGGEGSGPIVGGGEEGETCSRSADCAPNLRCIEAVCTDSAGSGGEGNVPTGRAGQIGETCQNVRDCDEGLTCIPLGGLIGVCDLDEYGLEPTGNSCTGECKTAADCCELPQNLTITNPNTAAVTTIFSCADLTAYINGANCAMAGLQSDIDTACFYQATYCGNCTAAEWACTNNKCIYGADCNNNGDILGGCPVRTRAGFSPTSTCDVAGTGKCVAPAGMGCTTDVSCNNQPVADSADTCSTGECTCYQSGCYRKCNENLDCPFRYECDMTENVCTPIGACATNSECATTMADVRAECRAGTCVVPCATDHECSGSGAGSLPIFTSMVCSEAGICEVLGCSSDDECGLAAGQPHLFCTPVAAPRPGGAVSAITD